MEDNKSFESWYNSITEQVKENADAAPAPTAPASAANQTDAVSPEISSDKKEMIKDVDTIMSQLAQLSVQVKEKHDIEIFEGDVINESAWSMSLSEDPVFQLISAGLLGVGAIAAALGFGASALADYKRNKKIGAGVEPDYNKLKELKLQEVKVQATIAQLQAKKSAISAMAGKSEDSDKLSAKKEELDSHIDQFKEKKDQLSTAAEEFQSSLLDKYSEENLYGTFSGKVRTLIALKKSEISATVTDYKLKVLGDTMPADTKKDLTERINAAKLEFKQNQIEYKKDIENNAKKVEAAKKKLPAEDKQKIEDALNPKKKDQADQSKKDEPKAEEPMKKEPKAEEPIQTTSIEEPKSTKLKNLKKLDQLLKQADEAGNETAIKKIKAKKKEIEAKESWQLEETTLGKLIEGEVAKIEMEMTLNEARYSSLSVTDKFRTLLG